MKRISLKEILVLLYLIAGMNVLHSQVTNSAYTMLGIGTLNDNGYGVNKMLGGTGIAFQSGKLINHLNPASYISQTNSSNIIEAGIYGMYSKSANENKSQTSSRINFDYLALNLHVTDWWGSSFGIAPFSFINFEVTSEDDIAGELTKLEKSYSGSGGLNKLYFGNSINVFKGLDIGMNLSYIFGPITQTESVASSDNFAGYELENEINAFALYLDYGLQYSLDIDDIKYTFGAIYAGSKKLNTSEDLTITTNSSITELESDETENLIIPKKFGVGFAISNGDRYRLGLDYEWADWSSVEFINPNLETVNTNKIALGFEYKPESIHRSSWYEKLTYRIGGNYKNSYLKVDGEPINSFSGTLGFGIPYDNLTSINMSFEYGEEGTYNNGLIKNNFFRFYIGIALHEIWGNAFPGSGR